MTFSGLWNVNLHDDARLDGCVPQQATTVLDVGTGDGFLAARLAQRVATVVAIDSDRDVLDRARRRFPDAPVQWTHADVLTASLEPGAFDAVVSNATLHHLGDASAALSRIAELLRPGGHLAVVTFVAFSPRNLLWHTASWLARGIAFRVRGKWQHSAPVAWPPPDTLHSLRSRARSVLPGVRVRRLLFGRVIVSWIAPTGEGRVVLADRSRAPE